MSQVMFNLRCVIIRLSVCHKQVVRENIREKRERTGKRLVTGNFTLRCVCPRQVVVLSDGHATSGEVLPGLVRDNVKKANPHHYPIFVFIFNEKSK